MYGFLVVKDRRLYEYAYGVLLGRVAIYLITVILGIATGNWLEMLVFLLPFTVLRQYAGGIHLEKAGSCMIVSSILVLLCSQYLASDLNVTWQMRIIWLVAVGFIFAMAPVDASSKKLDVKEEGGNLILTANYKLGNLDKAQWTIHPDGMATLDYTYNFSGVVDLMGICFDYPEEQVLSKRWLGAGPYRVWQNRIHGTQYDIWENDYNDPIPGETFTYPEFKGYFGSVSWMSIRTKEGTISLTNETPDSYIGVYQPRDGRDRLLYTLPESGISVLNVIPPVRNKVNSTDLCGPSSQPIWVDGSQTGRLVLRVE